MRNKILLCSFVTVFSIASTSCIKTEETTEFKIISNCVDLTCNIELAEVQLVRSTNMLGKTTEQIISKNVLSASNYNISWDVPSATSIATSSDINNANLPPCGNNGNCSQNSNPTGYIFSTTGNFSVNVTGTQTYPDGTTRPINETAAVEPPGNTITTQLTFSNGDYTAFDPSGTATASKISWLKNGNAITFTCPSGYAVPNNAPTITGDTNTILTNGTGSVSVVTLGSDTIAGVDYLVDKTARNDANAWYWQNTNGWNTYMTCVPVSEIANYS